MLRPLVMAAALSAALAGGASAAPAAVVHNGDYFATLCSSNARAHQELCQAYVISVTHAMSYSRIDGYKACPPNYRETWAHVRDIVYAWIGSRPQLHHISAVTLIALALAETYPCGE